MITSGFNGHYRNKLILILILSWNAYPKTGLRKWPSMQRVLMMPWPQIYKIQRIITVGWRTPRLGPAGPPTRKGDNVSVLHVCMLEVRGSRHCFLMKNSDCWPKYVLLLIVVAT